jgi:salicylate hydroxylase
MAQGAAMAIEDAYVLASSLENKTSIEAALNLFQQKRQNRVKNLYDISRRNAALYHASGIKAVVRNTLFAGARMFPQALSYQLDKVYGLNVTK